MSLFNQPYIQKYKYVHIFILIVEHIQIFLIRTKMTYMTTQDFLKPSTLLV